MQLTRRLATGACTLGCAVVFPVPATEISGSTKHEHERAIMLCLLGERRPAFPEREVVEPTWRGWRSSMDFEISNLGHDV